MVIDPNGLSRGCKHINALYWLEGPENNSMLYTGSKAMEIIQLFYTGSEALEIIQCFILAQRPLDPGNNSMLYTGSEALEMIQCFILTQSSL